MDIEGMPEHERLTILDSLEAEHPGAASLARGKLAGAATVDRPNVPIWEYRRYVRDHPQVQLDDLVAVRFPVIFYGGEEFTITSAAEYLNAGPIPSRASDNTLDSVVDLWRRLHDAGVVRWDSRRRAVENIRPSDDHREVLAEWAASLRQGNRSDSD